ncbi:MAG TPA: Rrf2 family transcriptional regulator [Planctomycetes bacterium]|nr:Rrf2 family transcriptional regulator [Planctomycetota bacterium]
MKLSSRSRYGLRAVLDLALHYGKGPLQIRAIAAREEISNKYLEQLMTILKTSGLVRSLRGPKGGYILSKPPDQIKLKEVITALEGPLFPVECLQHPQFCPHCAECITRQVWADVQEAMLGVLEATNMQDLVDRVKTSENRKA